MFSIIKLKLIFFVYLQVILAQIKLDINTIPDEVDVYLDNVNLGKSPIRNERIIPGEHIFEIKKKGYAPLKYELIVNPSKAVEIDFFLNPIHKCKFKTKEKGLVFELNGEHYWDIDNIRLDLEAGDHVLRVFRASKLIDEQNIRIEKPETFNYVEKKPISNP
ncbi:MAG: hypothetical protein CM15mP106_5210 [Candidatus Neomarinimicrobiota bacterium]|nr:MAG: hypothetical protein CM15mP106_5210 [Candidatus Neomarinimicrobiota bacterium]